MDMLDDRRLCIVRQEPGKSDAKETRQNNQLESHLEFLLNLFHFKTRMGTDVDY